MLVGLRWCLGLLIATLLVAGPFVYYRASYAHGKRLRMVTEGRFYRCGQLTQDGFADAVQRYGIRTVINLQNEAPDPIVPVNYFDTRTKLESQVCAELGIQYIMLDPDLVDPRRVPEERPRVLGEFLHVLDNPASYPILLHCKAGLHRTGLLTAVYRMEYEGWSKAAAADELKANGFGEFKCHSANDYVIQYLLTYTPRRSEERR